MIEVNIRKGPIRYKEKWFCSAPSRADAYRLVVYNQSRAVANQRGYRRTPFHTKLLDLSRSEADLLKGCRKNTINEIRRATREGVRFGLVSDPGSFVDFFNAFAASKGLAQLRRDDFIHSYGAHVQVTKSVLAGEDLASHCYLMDRDERRVRLLRSASLFRSEVDKERRKLLGRANRYLHYEDMRYFKAEGYAVYDFGGYALDTRDLALKRINDFKDSFGGMLREESHYVSLPLDWSRQMARLLRHGIGRRERRLQR